MHPVLSPGRLYLESVSLSQTVHELAPDLAGLWFRIPCSRRSHIVGDGSIVVNTDHLRKNGSDDGAMKQWHVQ